MSRSGDFDPEFEDVELSYPHHALGSLDPRQRAGQVANLAG